MLVLYQFPFSHFCERTLWHLDAKGIDYQLRDVAPGIHIVIGRRHQLPGTVPMLFDGDVELGDSCDIASYLEERYPSRPLLPADPDERTHALALEAGFAASYGGDARQWLYGTLAPRGGATSIWPRYYTGLNRLFVGLTRRFLEGTLSRMYRLSASNVAAARGRIDEHFDDLAERLDGRDYLVGERLSLADITASSLLGPLVAPDESPWALLDDLPEPVMELRQELRNHPAGAWISERYRADRRPS